MPIILTKIKELVKILKSEILLVLAIILISATSYNLGKISAIKNIKTPITLKQDSVNFATELKSNYTGTSSGVGDSNRQVFASKKSKAKLYHFSWCPGASKIASQNKLTFVTEAAAISAGFTLAGNCQK